MVLSVLQKRRSVRRFKNQPIEAEKVDQLVEALLRSPSSRGINPWEFILVNDRTLLRQLATAKEHGSGFLEAAPLAVVVCADTRKSDVWIEDCAIAAIVLQLTAESLGLGSCWAQIRERSHGYGKTAEEFVRELLHLPAHFSVASIIGVGYPDEKKEGHPRSALDYDKVHQNIHGQ